MLAQLVRCAVAHRRATRISRGRDHPAHPAQGRPQRRGRVAFQPVHAHAVKAQPRPDHLLDVVGRSQRPEGIGQVHRDAGPPRRGVLGHHGIKRRGLLSGVLGVAVGRGQVRHDAGKFQKPRGLNLFDDRRQLVGSQPRAAHARVHVQVHRQLHRVGASDLVQLADLLAVLHGEVQPPGHRGTKRAFGAREVPQRIQQQQRRGENTPSMSQPAFTSRCAMVTAPWP